MKFARKIQKKRYLISGEKQHYTEKLHLLSSLFHWLVCGANSDLGKEKRINGHTQCIKIVNVRSFEERGFRHRELKEEQHFFHMMIIWVVRKRLAFV